MGLRKLPPVRAAPEQALSISRGAAGRSMMTCRWRDHQHLAARGRVPVREHSPW